MKCDVCGHDPEKLSKRRSVPQLRRYFAMIRSAYEHWPDTHERQFTSAEECRAWLQMRAGWREVGAQLALTGIQKDRALFLAEAAIKAAGAMAVPVIHKGLLVVWRPKSIAFGRMSHDDFCGLVDAVEGVIEAETGISVADLIPQTGESVEEVRRA
jgi:hypothetical protein